MHPSIWEDNSRNCRLCHILKAWRGHSNISIVEECRALTNDHSEQVTIELLPRESHEDNTNELRTFALIL